MSLVGWVTEVLGISAPTTLEIVFICSIPILIFGLTILCIVLAIMKKSRGFALVGLSGIMTICLAGFSASGANFDPSIMCGLFVLTALAGIVLVIVEYVGKSNDTNVIMMQQGSTPPMATTEVLLTPAPTEALAPVAEVPVPKITYNITQNIHDSVVSESSIRLDTISNESEES